MSFTALTGAGEEKDLLRASAIFALVPAPMDREAPSGESSPTERLLMLVLFVVLRNFGHLCISSLIGVASLFKCLPFVCDFTADSTIFIFPLGTPTNPTVLVLLSEAGSDDRFCCERFFKFPLKDFLVFFCSFADMWAPFLAGEVAFVLVAGLARGDLDFPALPTNSEYELFFATSVKDSSCICSSSGG